MPGRRQILQIFNRYTQYGGEEGSVYRIGDLLQHQADVEYFLTSTAEVAEAAVWRLPWKAVYNHDIDLKLRQYQDAGRFDVWMIHNIFPVMSPIVYRRAIEWGVPVIHFLHNYRFGCVNGFFINHGQPCQRCISGDFRAAFTTACWHDSHLKSGWMGMVTHHIRQTPLFEKVFRWIAVSAAVKREHVRMGIPEDRIDVLHHFLEAKASPLPPVKNPTALFVGRLSVEKGVHRLLAAWKRIAGGERRLLIAGDGPERENLQRQAADLPGVEFLGFVNREQQDAVWARSLFSVMPSIWIEPFGMTVLEAWQRGRPVVAHDIGAMPELIQDGVNGLLADPARDEDLAAKMDHLFSFPEDAARMGPAGRETLERDFSQERWLGRMTKILQELPKPVR